MDVWNRFDADDVTAKMLDMLGDARNFCHSSLSSHRSFFGRQVAVIYDMLNINNSDKMQEKNFATPGNAEVITPQLLFIFEMSILDR